MQTKVFRIAILFILISISCINAFSKSFIKNGIYYVGYEDTKEATVIQANNKDVINIPNDVEYDDVTYKVTSINNNGLAFCTMKQLIIGNNVRSIGKGACAGCMSLTSVTMGESVSFIDEGAFSSCHSLKDISWPSAVTEIKKGMFLGCSLEDFTIPATVTRIGEQAFSMAKITNLYCQSSVPPSVFSDTFFLVSNMTVHVPEGSLVSYQNATVWKDYIITDDIPSAIQYVSCDDESIILKNSFNLNGQKNTKLKGIVIKQYSDGTIKKVLKR